jgi:2,4-dienoyl-CoA reductase-like NADH-dependent reductase (Old Yellow Enzyme family)
MEKLNLFSTLQLRDVTLKNRIVVSPMQQYSAVNGLANNWHLVHLGGRAVGGAGLIITECTAVSPSGRNTLSDTGIWNDAQVAAWKPVVQFVHEQGTKIAVQLWHAGGKGSHTHPNDGMKNLEPKDGGWITKSASSVSIDHHHTSEALALVEIKAIQQEFVDAALRAVEAGFDAIELHAGHGYLFHQFYSALVNHRTDEYGGSFENRIRFLLETIDAIRNVIPQGMPLLIRISAVDYREEETAWKIEDSVRLSLLLKNRGVDQITASGGGFANWGAMKVFPSYQVPFAEKIKSETGMVVGAVGAIADAKQADDLIASGQVDLVFIAKEFLRNPYFPINAALELKHSIEIPFQYSRAF